MGKVSLILPEATINYVDNPSGETNTTGWSVVNAAISQDSSESKYGSYSIKVLGNVVAAVLQLVPPTLETDWARGQSYTGSIWLKGDSATTVGYSLSCHVRETGGAAATGTTTVAVVLTGDWQKVTITAIE